MPLIDKNTNLDPVFTDDQKNTLAARRAREILSRAVKMAQRMVKNLKELADSAPGRKSGVVSKLGTDSAEAQAIVQKLIDLANSHKATNDEDVSF